MWKDYGEAGKTEPLFSDWDSLPGDSLAPQYKGWCPEPSDAGFFTLNGD